MKPSELHIVEESRFLEADLSRAKLENTNLESAILAAANLIGANLSGAHLQDADLGFAFYDQFTRFPEGFELPGTMRRSDDDETPSTDPT